MFLSPFPQSRDVEKKLHAILSSTQSASTSEKKTASGVAGSGFVPFGDFLRERHALNSMIQGVVIRFMFMFMFILNE
jgi:hypothetical protein